MPDQDETYMRQAIELAKRGAGFVEPNPMVGCVLVRDATVIGSGWHQRFGGPHAEINALQSIETSSSEISSGQTAASGATAYVTLEPCSHMGKTGPCSQALIGAGISRVVIACNDPNPLVSGTGIQQLRDAGIEVFTGIAKAESEQVLAPYLKGIRTGKPWIIAKWAMTLDGKIATASGDSQWISNEQSRQVVHQIRGRVDGVMVGVNTALADDPMLDARPAGPRVATRIVVDSRGRTPLDSKLVQSADQFPTLIAVGPEAENSSILPLQAAGCEVFRTTAANANDRLVELLDFLGSRGMTNVLVEGGGQLLGSLHDQRQIDEIHVFIGPKLLGGARALGPVGGLGVDLIQNSSSINISHVEQIDQDIYLTGRIESEETAS